jgi:hypothetical protein
MLIDIENSYENLLVHRSDIFIVFFYLFMIHQSLYNNAVSVFMSHIYHMQREYLSVNQSIGIKLRLVMCCF